MLQSLGIVEPVYREDQLIVTEDVPEFLLLFGDEATACRFVEMAVIYAEGKGLGSDEAVADCNGIGGGLQPQGAANCTEEVLRVVERVKADHVRPQYSPKNGLPPGTGHQAEDLEGGKRDVQEESYLRFGNLPSDHAGQQHQVVVVNPDQIG